MIMQNASKHQREKRKKLHDIDIAYIWLYSPTPCDGMKMTPDSISRYQRSVKNNLHSSVRNSVQRLMEMENIKASAVRSMKLEISKISILKPLGMPCGEPYTLTSLDAEALC